MAKAHSSFRQPTSWLPESHVFTDTQRVDLFDDPPWEMTPDESRRAASDAARRPFRRATDRTTTLRRVLRKRGRHSRSAA